MNDLAFTNSGTEILTAGGDGLIGRWNVSGKSLVDYYSDGGANAYGCLAFAPNGLNYALGWSTGGVSVAKL